MFTNSMRAIRDQGLSANNFSKHLRGLWVIDGHINHGFKLSVLNKISDVYERIDCVPEGYHQAELWASKDEPAFLANLKAKKIP